MTMTQLDKVLYTAKTHTTGGREDGAVGSLAAGRHCDAASSSRHRNYYCFGHSRADGPGGIHDLRRTPFGGSAERSATRHQRDYDFFSGRDFSDVPHGRTRPEGLLVAEGNLDGSDGRWARCS